MRYIELLSPAKDYDTARAAVDHGADAIYMGAARFGARRAAANSLEDVARTVEYAHQYGVRVHSTLNTVLYDDELADAEQMAEYQARQREQAQQELLDLRFKKEADVSDVMARMNRQLTDELRVTEVYVPETKFNDIAFAAYEFERKAHTVELPFQTLLAEPFLLKVTVVYCL